ncbi:MAG: substrate-binding domain-containing protein, partial [Ilumatobacteraceae bacterium]
MKKSRYLLAPLAAFAVLAAACSDDKTSSSTTAAGSTGSTEDAGTTAPDGSTATSDTVEVTEGEDITIAVITHGDGGVFWSVAQKGAEQAGADLGITVNYQGGNNDGAAQAKLIDDAVAAGVDGIAVSLADPGALESSVKAAVEAGIPLVTMNSGSDLFKELGAITHVGQDETVAGNGAGEKFAAEGKTKLLCVMQEQSNVGLQARCDGAAETFGGEVVEITTSGDADPTTSQSEIKAALDADADIDAVFATGPIGAILARDAAADLGRD